MTIHLTKIEELRRRMDRKRAEFDEAKRVNLLVNAPNWPEVKWWIEAQMAKMGDIVGNAVEPLAIAALMGGWNALRQLLNVAEKCRNLTELEIDLNTLHKMFQDQALREK
jgi:hypothetical protein